ncbi:uncharacterized protein EI90DRAFT_3013826 [Cantharellus anzutake]|uniref:uncharacterized protein n=1 Tax=Cantharellus anzutake TaxID=1750568 RepID=UPI0019066839|nr:uncharacterized protein EI90DRAFT_3013826 [Cantharellus anzutake]KAF8336814.1 hypothetical protein EI90DRAFT_3013826 [Cantharellus anzutake]
MWHLVGNIFFIAGFIIQLNAYLSPVPWLKHNPDDSLLKFIPYEEPSGYVPPNACQPGTFTNSSTRFVNTSEPLPRGEPLMRFRRSTFLNEGTVKRASNTANYSQATIWIGPLGSCNRDLDGRVYCTKPSYSNPQYNLTHVQDNSVFFSAIMSDVIHRRVILATIVLNGIGCAIYLFTSLLCLCTSPSGDDPAGGAIALLLILGIAEFFMNFAISVTDIGEYNSIDNFYDPSPCGTRRPLKAGILLKAAAGKMYNMIWVGWCLMFLVALFFLAMTMASRSR